MIIRRRYTANFTTIGNVLFEDDRLALDELGLMAWLRSRPNDWEVRRPALMRRFKVGRDGLRRIMRSLLRYGWMRAEVTRLSNGAVHIIYEVRDEPGPELSDEEARAALSLVSSGAGSGDPADEDGSADGPDHYEGGSDPPICGAPPTAQPEAASRLRLSPPGPIEESLNTDSVKTESTKAVRAFADVRAKWPGDHVLSVVACESLHLGLTDKGKEAAFRGVDPYLSDCKAQNRKVCDLATYYRERRWERLEVKTSAGGLYHLRRGTPQAHRWREFYERTDPQKLRMFNLMMERNGLTVPSEWPPSLPPKMGLAEQLPESAAKAFTGDG